MKLFTFLLDAGGDKGIGLAKSMDDEFNSWEKMDENPVIKSTEWGITEMTDQSI